MRAKIIPLPSINSLSSISEMTKENLKIIIMRLARIKKGRKITWISKQHSCNGSRTEIKLMQKNIQEYGIICMYARMYVSLYELSGACSNRLNCVSLATGDHRAATPVRIGPSRSSTVVVWVPRSIAWHVVPPEGSIADVVYSLSKSPPNHVIPHHVLLLLVAGLRWRTAGRFYWLDCCVGGVEVCMRSSQRWGRRGQHGSGYDEEGEQKPNIHGKKEVGN